MQANDYQSVVEKRNTDGSFERFNLTQHYKVCKAKKIEITQMPVDVYFPIVGRRFIHHGKVITFTKVTKHWDAGYHLVGTYVNEHFSEHIVSIKNINSIHPSVLNSLERFKTDFHLIA